MPATQPAGTSQAPVVEPVIEPTVEAAIEAVAEAVTELTNAKAKLEALQAEMAEMRKYLAEKTLMDQERQEALEAQAPGAKLKRKVAA